jgi:hypothetical protein
VVVVVVVVVVFVVVVEQEEEERLYLRSSKELTRNVALRASSPCSLFERRPTDRSRLPRVCLVMCIE